MASCRKDDIPPPQDESAEKLSGGTNFTAYDYSENAFGVMASGLSSQDETDFVSGNALFRNNWVTAPSSVQSLDGLGPIMNALSCGSCHFKDGRAFLGNTTLNPAGLLARISISNDEPDPVYGFQVQTMAIQGVQPEAEMQLQYETVSGNYDDGTSYVLRKPMHQLQNWNYGEPHPAIMVSYRIAPPIHGLGLLEQVPESLILSFADENDANGDGISGKANYTINQHNGSTVLGRFGWKAGQPDLEHQSLAAFNGDIGITSSLFPQDHLTDYQLSMTGNLPNGGEPELNDAQARKVVTYARALAVPARRNTSDATALRGSLIFKTIGCESCHVRKLVTGTGGPLASAAGQTIYPYTDLLLHDMGSELADGRPEQLANGNEWRTPPLWGIGLVPTVNGGYSLLHDGRAQTLEEAILWHGGEAQKPRDLFRKLNAADRAALIAFLESL